MILYVPEIIQNIVPAGSQLQGYVLQDSVRKLTFLWIMPAGGHICRITRGRPCLQRVGTQVMRVSLLPCLSGEVFAWLQYTRSEVLVIHHQKKSAPKGAPYFTAYFYNVAIVAGPGFFPVLICGRCRLFSRLNL